MLDKNFDFDKIMINLELSHAKSVKAFDQELKFSGETVQVELTHIYF